MRQREEGHVHPIREGLGTRASKNCGRKSRRNAQAPPPSSSRRDLPRMGYNQDNFHSMRFLLLGFLSAVLAFAQNPPAASAPPPPAAQTTTGSLSWPHFEDIGPQAGLTVAHISSPDKRYIIESVSGGIGLIDCDNDGKLDIVAVNGSNVDRYRHFGGRPTHTLSL